MFECKEIHEIDDEVQSAVEGLGSLGVLNNNNNGVASDEKLRDVSLSVMRTGTLSLSRLGKLSPFFTGTFKDHVHMAVKSLDAS